MPETYPIPSVPPMTTCSLPRDATLGSVETRLKNAIKKPGPLDTPCSYWDGPLDRHGYGCARYRGKIERTHRIAYMLANGPIPDGVLVMHRCDNRPCCNPLHLMLGTHLDNARDRESKGRGNKATGKNNGSVTHPERRPRGMTHNSCTKPESVPRGERVGTASLDETSVREIRLLLAAGSTHRSVAKRFGINHATVGRIFRRESWAHVA